MGLIWFPLPCPFYFIIDSLSLLCVYTVSTREKGDRVILCIFSFSLGKGRDYSLINHQSPVALPLFFLFTSQTLSKSQGKKISLAEKEGSMRKKKNQWNDLGNRRMGPFDNTVIKSSQGCKVKSGWKKVQVANRFLLNTFRTGSRS